MKKNNRRPTSYKARPKKKKAKKGNTPKRMRDEVLLITINDYDKYAPQIEELKARGITHENFREHMAEVEELRPLFEQCRKGVGK